MRPSFPRTLRRDKPHPVRRFGAARTTTDGGSTLTPGPQSRRLVPPAAAPPPGVNDNAPAPPTYHTVTRLDDERRFFFASPSCASNAILDDGTMLQEFGIGDSADLDVVPRRGTMRDYAIYDPRLYEWLLRERAIHTGVAGDSDELRRTCTISHAIDMMALLSATLWHLSRRASLCDIRDLTHDQSTTRAAINLRQTAHATDAVQHFVMNARRFLSETMAHDHQQQ